MNHHHRKEHFSLFFLSEFNNFVVEIIDFFDCIMEGKIKRSNEATGSDIWSRLCIGYDIILYKELNYIAGIKLHCSILHIHKNVCSS